MQVLGIKMANFCQRVLKPLGSYTRVITVFVVLFEPEVLIQKKTAAKSKLTKFITRFMGVAPLISD